jgi:Gas vesicle protein
VRERGILGGDTSGTSLVDVLDRVLQRGAYVSGDVVICLAGIDLARLDLRLLLTGIEGELPWSDPRGPVRPVGPSHPPPDDPDEVPA